MHQLPRFRSAAFLVSLLAVLALAGCSTADGGAGSGPAAGATSTTTGTAAGEPSGGSGTGGTDQPASTAGGTPTSAATSATPKQAEATAAYFLRTEIGMRQPVALPFKQTGKDTGEVRVYPGAASENGGPMPQSITTVSLRRQPGGWEVTGTRSKSIRVAAPAAGAQVSSPVRLTGSALAFEGTVPVQVHDNRNGKDQTLGEGYVTGGGDVFRPFSGSLAYRQPSTSTGWVVFYISSAIDGQVTEATFVRVRFQR